VYYFDIFSELNNAKVQFLIVGGLAVNLYGAPRVTQDIDIMIALDRENVGHFNMVLKKLGYVPRVAVDPEGLADQAIRDRWIKEKNMKAFSYFHQKDSYKVVDVVLFSPIDFKTARTRQTVKQVSGVPLPLIGIDDLITMKESSGREQDLSDVSLLKKIKQYQEQKND
jgi:hypothetical protein